MKFVVFVLALSAFADTLPLTTADSRLKVEVLRQGEGPAYKVGDDVTLHFEVRYQGKKIVSSRDRIWPIYVQAGIGDFTPAIDQGVLGMRPGEIRKVTAPPELSYGIVGLSLAVGPNAALEYEIEALKEDK